MLPVLEVIIHLNTKLIGTLFGLILVLAAGRTLRRLLQGVCTSSVPSSATYRLWGDGFPVLFIALFVSSGCPAQIKGI